MKKLFLLLATFGLINGTAHTLPSNAKVLGGTAGALVAADLLRGQNSFLRRQGAQLKGDLALLVSLATSKQSLREKLAILRQLFGRNWGKMTLFFLFVVMPLVQKYRNDPTWLKNNNRKRPPLTQDRLGKQVLASAGSAGSLGNLPLGYKAMKADDYYTSISTDRPLEVDDWVAVKEKTTWPEFFKGSIGTKAIDFTILPGHRIDTRSMCFDTKEPIRSGANALILPSTLLYRPESPLRQWLAKDTIARRVSKRMRAKSDQAAK